MKTIIVGTDFSEASQTATDQAMHIARHTGATLTLLHAGSPYDSELSTEVASGPEFDNLVRETEALEHQQLIATRERLLGKGVEVDQVVVDGFPDTSVCEFAEKVTADLVVTGTHGRSGLRRFLLGSVAERVVRLCDRPVLVSRNRAGAGGFNRILVPIDFSDLALKAVDWALALAAPDATIELFHCWQLPPRGATGRAADIVLKPIFKAIQTDVDSRGAEIATKYGSVERTFSFHSVREVPAQGIADRLEEQEYELVVMGSHGKRGFRRFLLGSVAEATVRHASCSVLVVRGDAPPQKSPQ